MEWSVRQFIGVLGCGITALAVPYVPATAQSLCADRPSMLEQLRDGYDERPRARGLESQGQLVEILVSPEGQSWTVLLTRPDGITCIAASGRHWQMMPSVPEPGVRS